MRREHILVLLILVAAPYLLAGVYHGFVYDDHGSIEDNPYLQNPRNVIQVVTFRTLSDPTIPDGRRPVVVLTYFADRVLWRLRPVGYHLTNLLLHLAATGALVMLLGRLRGADISPFIPVAGGLLFGLQPAVIEAVHVPAFREDLLVTLFALAYLLLATMRSAAAPPSRLRLAGSLVALLLALLSKESGIVAPAILFWLWICFPQSRPPARVAGLTAAASVILCLLFLASWLRWGPLQASSPEWAGLALQFPDNLATAPWLWLKALRTLAWPHPLRADYVITPVPGFLSPPFVLGLVAVVVAAGGAFALRRRNPWIAFASGWVLLGFLPVSNIIPLCNPFAERYLYLPAAGFAAGLAWILAQIRRTRLRAAALAAVAAAYVFVVLCRLPAWKDDFTLWSVTLSREPASARAHTWLGLESKRRGRFDLAYEHFQKADALKPREVSALINIAILYGQMGRAEEAEAILREAVRRSPRKADAHWNLAVALHALGREEEAMDSVRRTLEIDPRYPQAVLLTQGMSDWTAGNPRADTDAQRSSSESIE
jgi:protein O-mannosyl-transferase